MRGALITASVLALAGCNMAADAQEGSGGRTQRSFNLSGFDSVSVAGPHDVIVTVGPRHSVRAEGDADAIDRLEIKVDGGDLEIGVKRNRWNIGFQSKRPKTIVYVTLPAIEAASIAGSGDMRIDQIQGRRFEASIAGSGDLEIGSLRVGEADISVAGSGNIRATGTANRASISIAGSGDVALDGVETRTSSVSIVGSGDVRARAMESANVSIMGSGDVTISGTTRCEVSKMGSGSVRCGG